MVLTINFTYKLPFAAVGCRVRLHPKTMKRTLYVLSILASSVCSEVDNKLSTITQSPKIVAEFNVEAPPKDTAREQ